MSSDEGVTEALRAANPVPSASPTDATQRAALLKEILAMPSETTSQPSTEANTHRRRFAYAATVAAAAAALVVAIAIVNRGDTDSPAAAPPTAPVADSTPTTGPVLSPGVGLGSCVESYDLATLAHREVAFDGTVSAVEGNQVTFNVNEWFKGGSGASVTLDGNGMTGAAITSAGGPTLTVGQRFLVAGDGGFVWSCGFTQSYDGATAGQWRTALT
jgi:hypothetical protein